MMEIKSGRDIYRYLAKENKSEKWLADSCGVTVMTIFNWIKTRKLSKLHKRVLQSVVREEAGTLLSWDSVISYCKQLNVTIDSEKLSCLEKDVEKLVQKHVKKKKGES